MCQDALTDLHARAESWGLSESDGLPGDAISVQRHRPNQRPRGPPAFLPAESTPTVFVPAPARLSKTRCLDR